MVLGFRVRFRLVVWMKAAVFCRKNAAIVKHIVGAYIYSSHTVLFTYERNYGS